MKRLRSHRVWPCVPRTCTCIPRLIHSRGSQSCTSTTASCKILRCGEDLGWEGFVESHMLSYPRCLCCRKSAGCRVSSSSHASFPWLPVCPPFSWCIRLLLWFGGPIFLFPNFPFLDLGHLYLVLHGMKSCNVQKHSGGAVKT